MTTIYLSNKTILSIVDQTKNFPDNVIIGNVEERLCLSYGNLFQTTGMDIALTCKSDAAAQWLVEYIARCMKRNDKYIEVPEYEG